MKHWKIISLFLFFSVIGLFFFLSPSHAQKKPIELTLSNTWPATAKHNILSVEWGKEIEKRTNGRVKVTVFPAGTLTSAAQCYQGTVDGLSDIGYCVLAYTRGRFPLTEVIDLPLGYNSGFEATKLINIFYNKFKPAEFDDIKMMYLHATSPSFLYTKKPVTKLEDLKGMKLVCSGMTAKVLGALGAVPVALPMIDRYDAIQRGAAEGGMSSLEALKTYKIGELINYITRNVGTAIPNGFSVAMKKEKWAALPPDIKKIIEEINKEWIVKTGQMWDQVEEEGVEFSIAKGVKVINLSKTEDERWHKLVQPILDNYVEVASAKKLPGAEALKFCIDELKRMRK